MDALTTLVAMPFAVTQIIQSVGNIKAMWCGDGKLQRMKFSKCVFYSRKKNTQPTHFVCIVAETIQASKNIRQSFGGFYFFLLLNTYWSIWRGWNFFRKMLEFSIKIQFFDWLLNSTPKIGHYNIFGSQFSVEFIVFVFHC